MPRIVQDGVGRAGFHDLAGVHHRDARRHRRNHADVVGDENDAEPHLLLQLTQQAKHLRLNSDVERGRRLIGDQQPRLAHQRHGDHRPLSQAAGQLMGKLAEALRRGGNAHAFEQHPRTLARRGTAA